MLRLSLLVEANRLYRKLLRSRRSSVSSFISNRGGDAITIDGASKIWVDHLTTSLIGRQHIVLGYGANKGRVFSLEKKRWNLREVSSSRNRAQAAMQRLTSTFPAIHYLFSRSFSESPSVIIISQVLLPSLRLGEFALLIALLYLCLSSLFVYSRLTQRIIVFPPLSLLVCFSQ